MKAGLLNIFFFSFFLSLSNSANAGQIEFPYKSDFLSGYQKEVSGETINYYTVGGQSIDALLVRSLDSKDFIEWQTEPVPVDYKEETISFIMIASLQVSKEPRTFDIYLNNKKYFTLTNPAVKSLTPIKLTGINNSSLEFGNLEYDRFEDLTGYLSIKVPAKDFAAAMPVNIRVVGQSAKSRTWFMVYKHNCKSSVSLSSENIILNSPGIPKQSMRVKIFHMTEPAKAVIKIGDIETKFDVKFGYNYLLAGLERIEEERELPVEFILNGKVIGSTKYLFKPVRPVTIYLLPHSHVDIGYTHVQDDVKKIQWEHIENAIDLGNKTFDYPFGSRFKWNTEVMWALDSYLDAASSEKKSRLIDAVQKGIIGIDGVYANMMTGLLNPEEWIRMMDYVRKVNSICKIKIESAMICDVPGWSWSMVPMLADAGIKYFSCGINQGDRIGSIRKELGDKPFYWVSPSGNNKVLTWVHEQGYSAFHFVPKAGTENGFQLIEPTIVNYVNKLADDKCPYNIIPLHYTIGSDNGPTDKYLANNIRKWNETYLSPKIVIATTAEFFREFEKVYGNQLPELKGDITPYWEDGAASSAKETALNRENADKLSQALYLTVQYAPSKYSAPLFNTAWQNVLLYDEHTWGSWNSISEPDIDFTIQQWKVKQKFAIDASAQANALMNSAIAYLSPASATKNAVDVFNTSPAARTDIAALPADIAQQIEKGLSLADENNNFVPVQKLTDGSTVFVAADVPALGSKRFFINKPKAGNPSNRMTVTNSSIENEYLKIEIDTVKGVISKITTKENGHNFVSTSDKFGMGAYIYVSGRKPDNPVTAGSAVVRIKENGPIVSSLMLQLKGEGCNSIEQEIKLISGINRVDINYTLDKKKVYTPEAVRFAFPVNVPEGIFTMENAYGIYRPEKEQIKGSCKNFYTINNYADLSNKEFGITLVSPDAPLIETGSMTNDANPIGWRENCMPGSTIYSYVMNNYWHTNFCATQEGKSAYRYHLYPHRQFNPAAAALNGLCAEQPLIAVAADKDIKASAPLIRYQNENVFMVSAQPLNGGKAVWAAFYNASVDDSNLDFLFSVKPAYIFESDLLKNKNTQTGNNLLIPAKGLKYLLIEW